MLCPSATTRAERTGLPVSPSRTRTAVAGAAGGGGAVLAGTVAYLAVSAADGESPEHAETPRASAAASAERANGRARNDTVRTGKASESARGHERFLQAG
jgi:hypothetical protein